MMRGFRRVAFSLLLSLSTALAAQAGTVHGTVKNGTTGKPAAGIEVILLQLQGGMQPVANTKTDAQGQFSFDHPSLGAQPMLVRAVYKDINFHQPVPPGRTDVQVDVYEPSKDPKTISVGTRIVFFQPNGEKLTVGEEYSIQNNSQPPQAFFRKEGNFEFAVPEKAQLQQVAVSGPGGMPVVQSPIDKSKGRYAIAYAFRPGQNMVRYSYEVAYPGNAATVTVPTVYPTARLLVVAAPTMLIAGQGLQPEGEESGMKIYGRENVTPNMALTVSVSGTAPPLEAGVGADPARQGRDAQPSETAGAGVQVQQIPSRVDLLRWPQVGGLVAVLLGFFAVGAILLSRKQVVAVASGVAELTNTVTGNLRRSAADSSSSVMANLDSAVGTSLDGLKDQLFRLELRRQAGTISEEEYAQERARAEKVLRQLVRADR
jgi:hypothetical protein